MMGYLKRLLGLEPDYKKMCKSAEMLIEHTKDGIKITNDEIFYTNSILERLIFLDNEPSTCAPYANKGAVLKNQLGHLENRLSACKSLRSKIAEELPLEVIAEYYETEFRGLMYPKDEYCKLCVNEDNEDFTIEGKKVYLGAKAKVDARIENSLIQEGLGTSAPG